MTPTQSIEYLSTVCADYARTLPPSAQGPTVAAINQALSTLEPLARAAEVSPAPPPAEDKPRLAAVPAD